MNASGTHLKPFEKHIASYWRLRDIAVSAAAWVKTGVRESRRNWRGGRNGSFELNGWERGQFRLREIEQGEGIVKEGLPVCLVQGIGTMREERLVAAAEVAEDEFPLRGETAAERIAEVVEQFIGGDETKLDAYLSGGGIRGDVFALVFVA